MKGKTFLENKWLLDPQELRCLAIVNIVLDIVHCVKYMKLRIVTRHFFFPVPEFA